MHYDIAIRHQQALDPSALTTITGTLHALTRAIEDCRHAGVDHEADPAVIVLARHFGVVTGRLPDDGSLRRRCSDAITNLRQRPALLAQWRSTASPATGSPKRYSMPTTSARY